MNSRSALVQLLGADVSRETWQALELYASRLAEWNRRINLVAPGDMERLWQRHILDCAQLHRLAAPDATWLDFGSGAGLPGLVIAILRREEGGHMHMIESNHKKAAFLASMVAELRLHASVHARRVEDLHARLTGIDIVSARAVASLPRLLLLARPWLEAGAHALFQKGRDFGAELDQCRDAWQFDLLEHASRIDRDSVILELWGVRRTGNA